MKKSVIKISLASLTALAVCAIGITGFSSIDQGPSLSAAELELKEMGQNLGKGSLDPSLDGQELEAYGADEKPYVRSKAIAAL